VAAVGHRFQGWGRLFGGKPTQLALHKWHSYCSYTVFMLMANTWHNCFGLHYHINQPTENEPTSLKTKEKFKFEVDVSQTAPIYEEKHSNITAETP